MWRMLAAVLGLAGCIDFPEAPRCTPGGCPSGLVCDPATAVCIEGQDFGFLEPDQGVGGDSGVVESDVGGAGGSVSDAGPPRDGAVGDGPVDALAVDASEPTDAAAADAGLADAAPPDAAIPPDECEAVEVDPLALEGGNVTEVALASTGEDILVAWSLDAVIPGNRQLRVRVGNGEVPLPAEALDFDGEQLHAAGGDNRFALTWVVSQRAVVVRLVTGGLDGLQPPITFERANGARHPQVIAVPDGWVVVWQESAADGVRFVRVNISADGIAGEPLVLNPANPLGNPGVVRPHTLVARGNAVFVVWDPGPLAADGGRPPGLYVGRMAAAFDNRAYETLSAPPGQAPTAAVFGDRVYVMWAGMNNAVLAFDAEHGAEVAPPPTPIEALQGRRSLVAANDGGELGVLACTIEVAGTCTEVRYVRATPLPPLAVPPEWLHPGDAITRLRLVAHNRGVAAAWIERRDQQPRALFQSNLLTPACRRP